jgi:hypothetical protein
MAWMTPRRLLAPLVLVALVVAPSLPAQAVSAPLFHAIGTGSVNYSYPGISATCSTFVQVELTYAPDGNADSYLLTLTPLDQGAVECHLFRPVATPPARARMHLGASGSDICTHAQDLFAIHCHYANLPYTENEFEVGILHGSVLPNQVWLIGSFTVDSVPDFTVAAQLTRLLPAPL